MPIDPVAVNPNDSAQPTSGSSRRQESLTTIVHNLQRRVKALESGDIVIPDLNDVPAPTGDVDLAGFKLTSVADPVSAHDALNLETGNTLYAPAGSGVSAGSYVQTSEVGAADGVASLDSAERLLISELPVQAIAGGLTSAPTIGKSVTFLPLPSGVAATDTANLNSALSSGGRVRPNPLALTATYILAAPLVVVSNSDVDFGGCTFTLNGQFNMLQNTMCTPTFAGTATTTAGQNTIVSASLVPHASIGMQIAVEGAGSAGGNPQTNWSSGTTYGLNDSALGPDGIPYVSLQNGNTNHTPATSPTWWRNTAIWMYGTISHINSGTNTITLDGSGPAPIVNGVAATNSLSNAPAHLYATRDSNISVSGGIWDGNTIWNDHGTRYAAGFNSCQLRFRRVDGLTIKNATLVLSGFPQGGGWVFGINPADCTNFLIENCTGRGSSTVVQLEGPSYLGFIRNIRGQTQDDQVAIGTVGASGADCEGDIKGVVVDGILANASLRACDLFAGQGSNGATRPLSGISVRGVRGTTLVDCVKVINWSGNATISCELADITATPGPGNPQINTPTTTSQPGISIKGPNTGLPLVENVISSDVALTSTAVDVSSATFVAPPSGAVWLEAWVYSIQLGTPVTQPALGFLLFADSSNAAVQFATTGARAASESSPSISIRWKLTGLTSGTSYTYKLRANVNANAGSGTLLATAHSGFMRVVAD